jgi:hypothetical protein
MFNAQMKCKEFNMTNSTTEIRNSAICEYVQNQFIATGKHVFIGEIAEHFKTNAKTVRIALDSRQNNFEYFEADRWSGSNFSGRYVQSWAVEPSKLLLIKIIQSTTTVEC